MTPLERQTCIKSRLAVLSPDHLEVIDESDQHRGHAGAQSGASHFALVIVSAHFEGLSLIQSHRKIYALLGDLIPHEVHALKISARAC